MRIQSKPGKAEKNKTRLEESGRVQFPFCQKSLKFTASPIGGTEENPGCTSLPFGEKEDTQGPL